MGVRDPPGHGERIKGLPPTWDNATYQKASTESNYLLPVAGFSVNALPVNAFESILVLPSLKT